MLTGSSDLRRFKKFQIRWAEKLGNQDCPYLIRWTFLFFGYSIRIHHWLRSDDNRFFHDHSADLLSIVLKGKYWNVKPWVNDKNPWDEVEIKTDDGHIVSITNNQQWHYVEGIFNSWYNFTHMSNSIWFSKAEDRHYLAIPKGGAWTLMFEGKPKHKWGFYVNGRRWCCMRYFHKYGIRQDKDYQIETIPI